MKYYWQTGLIAVGSVLFVVYLIILQGNNIFPDPDAIYHLGLAENLWHFGLAGQFSGLSPTVLGSHWVDQHFVLHTVLGMARLFMLPATALKVTTISLLLICLGIFSWMLSQFKWRGWWLAVLALCLTNPWLFRMNLVKATPLALILLWSAIVALNKKQYRWLLVIGFTYVWTHGGFPLLLIVIGLWQVSQCLVKQAVQWRDIQPILYGVGGLILGLILQPAFPHNLYYYWEQLVQIGALNYQAVIGVGGEWYPSEPVPLLLQHSVLFGLWLIGITLHLSRRQPSSGGQLFFLLTTAFFLLLTLKSRRYVEYLSPFAAASVASLMPNIFRQPLAYVVRGAILAGAVIMAVIPLVLTEQKNLYQDLQTGETLAYLQPTAQYLATLPSGVVAPSDWDDFPALWRGAPQQHFLIGLDPTFLYRANPERYQAWKQVTLGEAADVRIATDLIAADYYVITKDHKAMWQQLATLQPTILYEDAEAWIIEL